MKYLVLDTIHGGNDIANVLRLQGNDVDAVDVYRNPKFSFDNVIYSGYDRVIVPVHLNFNHNLIPQSTELMTHHQIVKELVSPPPLSIEITGATGKTTTAFALAHIMSKLGNGILHTSNGTYKYPERKLLWRKSITPASIISACEAAHKYKA
ncbi:MAG TPA: coenzyme F430 synthase, partial [Methanocorpusculum sp.]|nr:coenzyme F430 synthase [Methanocorpusculum sp.]